MKKTLIAVAALAATGAFAQTIITGTVDPMLNTTSVKYGNGNSRTNTDMVGTQVGTTNVTISGTEDLGGGLKALFLYELDFDPTAASNVPNAGQMYAGLQGNFGAIKLGVPNTPSLTAQGSRSGFGTKIGGGRGGMGVGGTSRTRTGDSINYTSNNLSGFTLGLNYTPETTDDPNTAGDQSVKSIMDIGAFYANGPLAAGVAIYSQEAGAVAGVNQTTAYVNYTMGPAKLFAGYQSQVTKAVAGTDTKLNGYNVGLNYSVSPATTLLVNIASSDDDSAANQDLSMTAVGVQYALSKRTSLHARYIAEKKDNVTAATGVKEQTTTLVGIQHNF